MYPMNEKMMPMPEHSVPPRCYRFWYILILMIMAIGLTTGTGTTTTSNGIQIDFSYIWSQHTNQVLYIYDQLSQPDRDINQTRRSDSGGESGQNWDNDNVCRISMQQLVADAKNRKYYANKMIDSVGRPTSGILEGRLTYLGQYEECVETTGPSFGGKYCIAYIELPPNFSFFLSNISGVRSSMYKNLPVKLGTCLPNTCSGEDIGTVANKFAKMFRPTLSVKVIECVENNDGAGQRVDILSVSIFGGVCAILLLLVLIGTLYDHYHSPDHTYTLQSQQKLTTTPPYTKTKMDDDHRRVEVGRGTNYRPVSDSIWAQILMAFSAKQNVKKILFVTESNGRSSGGGGIGSGNRQSIEVFHGIRFFAMVWVIFIHSKMFATLWMNIANQMEMKSQSYNVFSQVLINGSFCVDTFFFMSGFLVMYNLKRMIDSGKWNLASFYLNRYIRMTPVMMFVIAFGVVMLRYFNSGPEWTATTIMLDQCCRQNWWINMIYLNNFIRTEAMCLGPTWYLANDFQFFIISPFLIILLLRRPFIGLILTGTLLLSSVAITWALIEVNNYPGVPYYNDIIPQDLLNAYYKHIYIKPYCRIGPYLVGLLLAYALVNTKNHTKPTKSFLIAGWLFTLVCTLGVILAMPVNGIDGHKPNQHMAAAYGAISRTIWGLGLAWITYISIRDPDGIVQRFLSLKIWVPGSRLTFCAFLSHLIVIVLFYGTRNQTFDYSFYLLLYFSLSNLFISFVVAFILAMVIEYPFMTLGKIAVNRIF